MRRDLLIGVLVSLLVHAGLGWGELLFAHPVPPPAPAPEAVRTIEVALLPPDDPAPLVLDDAAPAAGDLAPPTLADLPSVNLTSPFVQPIQPPAPPSLGRPAVTLVIPVGRTGTGLGRGLGELFALADLDQKPVPIFQPQPIYPYEMRRAGIVGEVVVGFIVDSEGNVRGAHAISSNHREFEASAVQAVLTWKFRPGKVGGRPVNTSNVQVPIQFILSE